MQWVEVPVEPGVLYRGRNYELLEVPMLYETRTHYYDMRNNCLIKQSTQDTIFSSDRQEVIVWLRKRRDNRVHKLNSALAQVKSFKVQEGRIYKCTLSRSEDFTSEYHTIDTIGKTVKTLTIIPRIRNKVGQIILDKAALYLKPARAQHSTTDAQLAFGTWFIIGDRDDQALAIEAWLMERIAWLESLDWS